MDPYSAAAKLVYKALAVLALVATLVFGYLRIQTLTAQRDMARVEAQAIQAELAIQQANAEFSASLTKRALERATMRSKAVQQVRGGIAHVEVPEACRGVLAPLRNALDGVLRLQTAEVRVATAPGAGL